MDFKILWIDDSPDWVASIQGVIEDHIKDHDFTPDIIHQEDDSNIDEFIFRPDIDMIIVDYTLNGSSGDQVIDYLRKMGNFLEIVFYSQDEIMLRQKLSAHTEHVHCVSREDVEEKIKALIDFSMHKYSNVGYMRGSVIAEAIDIENILERIMVLSFGAHGGMFRTRVLDKFVYDFYNKYRYVQRLLKSSCSVLERKADQTPDEDSKLNILKEYRDIMKEFSEEVVERRNTLAHAQKDWDENGKLHLRGLNKKKEDIDVSREWMMEMRSILVKYRGVLNHISDENLLLESEETL